MEVCLPVNDGEGRRLLEGQLRECYGRVVYTHKTHEKCADILARRSGRIKLAQISLSAVASGGCIAAVLGAGTAATVVAAIVSTALLAVNTYTKSHAVGEDVQKHKEAAARLWGVRERYLSLITDLRIGTESVAELRARRDGLMSELQSVYAGAPATSYPAYRRAQKALTELEDMTFSEEEVDAFLPKELKRVGASSVG